MYLHAPTCLYSDTCPALPSPRDNADGSVVQFYYGEDGLDVTNTSYMHQFGFLAANADSFAQRLDVAPALATSKTARLGQAEQEVAQEARWGPDAAAGSAACWPVCPWCHRAACCSRACIAVR